MKNQMGYKIKSISLIAILAIIFSAFNAYAQSADVRKEVKFTRKFTSVSSTGIKFVDLTKYLPKGYKTDGTVDYTKYLQKGISENKNVMFPNFPIQTQGIKLISNSNLFFQQKSQLILKPTAETHYNIISIIGKKNISIYNATLKGDLDKHLGKTGEWGFGIDIRGSQNIKVVNAVITNCWGDGICISSNQNKFTTNQSLLQTSNIQIENSLIDYNRRNGITIASGVNNVLLKGLTISNTFGTLPKAGIDIEPDHSKGKLDNIKIYDSYFFNNNAGINIHINNYADKSVANNVSIDIANITFESQESALYFGGFTEKPNKRAMSGLINMNGLKMNKIRVPISRRMNGYGIYPNIKIRNVKINQKSPLKNELLRGMKDLDKVDI